MPGIEGIVREAATERADNEVKRREDAAAADAAREAQGTPGRAEAEAVRLEVTRAFTILKGRYLMSSGPFRSRICPAMESAETVLQELDRLYPAK